MASWHDEFLKIVVQDLGRRRKRNPRYSIRQFAAKIDLSVGATSEFLRSERKLSIQRALQVLKNIEVAPAILLKIELMAGLDTITPIRTKMSHDQITTASLISHISLARQMIEAPPSEDSIDQSVLDANIFLLNFFRQHESSSLTQVLENVFNERHSLNFSPEQNGTGFLLVHIENKFRDEFMEKASLSLIRLASEYQKAPSATTFGFLLQLVKLSQK